MNSPRSKSAFTLIELLVVIAIIGILATITVPVVQNALRKGQMTKTLANAKALHLATHDMTIDTFTAGTGEGLDWTSMDNGDGTTTPASLDVYFDALVRNNYLTRSELRALLSAPGRMPSGETFNTDNIAFKVFEVSNASPTDQPFVVTANWQNRTSGLDDSNPYGEHGFVVFNKGGGGGVFSRPDDARSDRVFPDAGSTDGGKYSYVTLN